ncbi:glycosyltransferase [Swaminathania salitolerans]|uniref:glycosyltransferase n=1 Tax=Swaminathania salitolerans TaxID=182838 RepID=UPI0011BFCAE8|nr:glycosyltransferase [Swaminathania salitolerans]
MGLFKKATIRVEASASDASEDLETLAKAVIRRDWTILGDKRDRASQEAPWLSMPAALARLLRRFLEEADRNRDAGNTPDAALLYEAAYTLSPSRMDLYVQCGNMLKDSGDLERAERVYRDVISKFPDEAEAYLQLGHTFKISGRRNAALDAYRAALKRDPGNNDAHDELILLGDSFSQHAAAQHIGFTRTLIASLDVARKLEAIGEELRSCKGIMNLNYPFTAIPREDFSSHREMFVAENETKIENDDFAIVLPQFDVEPDLLQLQIDALARISDPFRLVTIGATPAVRENWDRPARLRRKVVHIDTFAGLENHIERENVLFLSSRDIPTTNSLRWFKIAIESGADFAYCDEIRHEGVASRGTARSRISLLSKPCFDEIWNEQVNYLGSAFCVKNALFAGTPLPIDTTPQAYLSRARKVAHIPYPLIESYRELSDKSPSGSNELPTRFASLSRDHDIHVVICTHNNAASCRDMIASLRDKARACERVKITVVDNRTSRPNDLAILESLEDIAELNVVRDPHAFNWSHMNNEAASLSDSHIVVFCNDDMEMLSEGWDDMLSQLLDDDEVGMVGAKLLYADDTIQHGGILLGWQGSVIHDGLYEPMDSMEQFARWQCTRECEAVTGAFLAMRLSLFQDLGCFNAEHLAISYSDVDLSLRVSKSGYKVLWTPAIRLRHDESVSRGLDHLDSMRQARAASERRCFERIWGESRLSRDRTVNPVWADVTLPFRLLRPVNHETAIQHIRYSMSLNKRSADGQSAP